MKQGEIDYMKKIGEANARGAYDKPFSHFTCSKNLVDLGLIMSLLPQPPARLLDLGCGTGWTSAFFARRGYRVTGQDIAPDMIDYARQNKTRYEATDLDFVISDYESLAFEEPFDCAVFYDSLHHAVDEHAALKSVYRSLRPGGVLVTHEPGAGHSLNPDSIQAMQLYGVTEKDMPPAHIRDLCMSIGFSHFDFLVDPTEAVLALYGINLVQLDRDHISWWRRAIRVARLMADRTLRRGGICVITK
ncbi:MAG TPA: class I SAM-dependent methyltransferase [Burkholderiaceae bacterium]|nr:class I SAM-dependent methyltransferase [Burkholderiaceae bacterium]